MKPLSIRLLLSLVLLSSVSVSAQDVEEFVNRQMLTYPKSRLLDIYKSCFQDYMGAEHLVSDRQRVKAYLDEELNITSLDDLMPWYYEPCGIDTRGTVEDCVQIIQERRTPNTACCARWGSW